MTRADRAQVLQQCRHDWAALTARLYLLAIEAHDDGYAHDNPFADEVYSPAEVYARGLEMAAAAEANRLRRQAPQAPQFVTRSIPPGDD